MEIYLKNLRFYLDTHIIDYLYDHRKDYWQDTQELPTISKVAVIDHSDHIDELVALQAFLILAYWNDFILVIGDRLLNELEKIPNDNRKSRLLRYAESIRHFYSIVKYGYDDEDEEGESPKAESDNLYYTTFLSQVLTHMNEKDRPLYIEAIERKCNYFLTTDKQVIQLRNTSQLAGLEITSPAVFIRKTVELFPRVFDLSSYENRLIPELDFYSWLIPDDDKA